MTAWRALIAICTFLPIFGTRTASASTAQDQFASVAGLVRDVCIPHVLEGRSLAEVTRGRPMHRRLILPHLSSGLRPGDVVYDTFYSGRPEVQLPPGSCIVSISAHPIPNFTQAVINALLSTGLSLYPAKQIETTMENGQIYIPPNQPQYCLRRRSVAIVMISDIVMRDGRHEYEILISSTSQSLTDHCFSTEK